jgi:ferredoxin
MRVRVDLAVCETHAQCVFAAPQVFDLDDDDRLVYVTAPDDALRPGVERAVHACPVRAIVLDGG